MSCVFNSTLLEKRKSNLFNYTIQKPLFIYSKYIDLVITKLRFFKKFIYGLAFFRGLSAEARSSQLYV